MNCDYTKQNKTCQQVTKVLLKPLLSTTPKYHTDFCAYKAHTVCYMCICLLCFLHMHKNCTSILGRLTMKFYSLFKINTVAHVGDSKLYALFFL